MDVEAMLQYAGSQLCSQQSATCGLLTESGKNFFYSMYSTPVH